MSAFGVKRTWKALQHLRQLRTCERVIVELPNACESGLTSEEAKKRGPRERSSPPCQIRTLTLLRCPEARGNIFGLGLTLTRKFFELSGHAARPSRITSSHHQTVFEPPFMTASARYRPS